MVTNWTCLCRNYSLCTYIHSFLIQMNPIPVRGGRYSKSKVLLRKKIYLATSCYMHSKTAILNSKVSYYMMLIVDIPSLKS